MSDAQWREKLTPEQYAVLRQCGTEPPFENAYWNHHEDGTYRCAACDATLFSSETKFDSGTGWPSFSDVTSSEAIDLIEDRSHGMSRTEVKCRNCGGHLGHLFNDGPTLIAADGGTTPDGGAGKRFCINSASLNFEKKTL